MIIKCGGILILVVATIIGTGLRIRFERKMENLDGMMGIIQKKDGNIIAIFGYE